MKKKILFGVTAACALLGLASCENILPTQAPVPPSTVATDGTSTPSTGTSTPSTGTSTPSTGTLSPSTGSSSASTGTLAPSTNVGSDSGSTNSSAVDSTATENTDERDPNDLTGTYDITLWVSESPGVTELTKQQIKEFEALNPGIVINATVEGLGEYDSATKMIISVEDGADIFCFAQDQLNRLVEANALNKLDAITAEEVSQLNDSASLAAATYSNELYCYPMTSDNGYFMYYDKSVVKPEHINSLEDIIADCEEAGKMFSFELETSAWYNASFFFATGCHSTWITDTNGTFTSVDDNFNSDNGIIALKGMQKLLKSPAYLSSSSTSDFVAREASAVVVSGMWGAKAAMDVLGDNYGVAKLPSFTVDGKSYQLGSFFGHKLMGCKPSDDAKKNAVLSKLALHLTSEKAQLERYEWNNSWIPSNIDAQNNEKVQSNLAAKALLEQSQFNTPQGQIHAYWWDIAKIYCTYAKTATTNMELKTALEIYEESINSVISVPDSVRNSFTVIGSIADSSWSNDFAMTETSKGVWISDDVFNLKAGDEFKCRLGKSWDVSFGKDGDNYIVEVSGNYKIQLIVNDNLTVGEITLIPA